MRKTRTVAVIALLGVASITAATASATTTKLVKCTPGVQKSRPIKTVVKGQPALFRWVTTYPKGSGHAVIGGLCQANKKGLGKRTKVYIKTKPNAKHTPPKTVPPTTVVGNPPPVTVTPPAPPVNPPAPPTSIGTYSCDGFNPATANYLNANVEVRYTATGEYVFQGVTFAYDGVGSPAINGVKGTPGLASGSHLYDQAGTHNVIATLYFGRIESIYKVTCSTQVTVVAPPPAVCHDLGIVAPGFGSGDTLVSLRFFLPKGAAFVSATFNFGGDEGTDISNSATYDPLHGWWESDDSHSYRFSNAYTITGVVAVDYSNGIGVLPTRVISTITLACAGTVTITGLPPTPPVI